MIKKIKSSLLFRDVCYISILFVIPFCRYWRLFSSNVLDRRWLSSVDMISQYADRFFFYKNLKKGILALWHPNLTGGFPLFANVQDGLFYPFNLIDFLTMKKGILVFGHINAIQAIHYAMAGIFMYLCVRAFKLSQFASFVAGLSYMLCGFFWAHLNHIEIVVPASYLPLIFMQIYLSFEKKSVGHAVFAGFVLGIAFLYSHPPTIFYMLFYVGFYLVFKVGMDLYREGWTRKLLSYPALFLLMILVFSGVCAVQLIPTMEITMFNPRLNPYYDFITIYVLNFRNILSIFIPWLARDWEWGVDETYGYLGLFPIYLALMGFMLVRFRLVFFFSGMAFLSFILLLGKNSFLFPLFYNYFPGMNLFRIPPRFLYLLSISVAFLSAYGIDGLFQKDSDGRYKKPLLIPSLTRLFYLFLGTSLLIQIVGASGVSKISDVWVDNWNFFFVVFCAVYGVLKLYDKGILQPNIVKFLIAFLIVFDLTGATINVRTTKDDLFDPTLNRNSVLYDYPHIQFLQKQKSPFRVKDEIGIVGNLGYIENLYDIPCLGHNQNDPMRLQYYTEFIKYASYNPRLWDFLNAKYLVSARGLDGQSLGKYNPDGIALDQVHFQKDFSMDEWDKQKTLTAIELLSCLKESRAVSQGTVIAEVLITDLQNQVHSFPVRAGIETSEIDYDREQTASVVQHQKAVVASSWSEAGTDYESHLYAAEIKVDPPIVPKKISIRYMGREGRLVITKLELNRVNLFDIQDRYRQIFTNVYENKYALPRAFLVPQAAIIPDDRKRIEALRDLEPLKTVLLKEGPLGYGMPETPIPDLEDASVIIESFYPDRILIKTQCSQRSFLVTSEIWYPGWKAIVDGKETKIFRANHSFRALYLEPGSHVVEMVFDPFSFRLGLVISAGTMILLCMGLFLWGFLKIFKRRNKPKVH